MLWISHLHSHNAEECITSMYKMLRDFHCKYERETFSLKTQNLKSTIVAVELLSCLTLCDPMDYSLPGFSLLGIFQARILEWVAISFSKGFSWPRDGSRVSCIAGRFFTIWAKKSTIPPFKNKTCNYYTTQHLCSWATIPENWTLRENLYMNIYSTFIHIIWNWKQPDVKDVL